MANGVILYRGPSMLDGAPIACIATGIHSPSENPKTGAMVQTWIIRTDLPPHHAVRQGLDSSVCGNCPLRGRRCYVHAWQAPAAVWRTAYPEAGPEILAGKRIRFGAYGDPLSVPLQLWQDLAEVSSGWTGYTHLWRYCHGQDLVFTAQAWEWQDLLMASVETAAAAAQAQGHGWRTFRVLPRDGSGGKPWERPCPNPATGRTCHDCLLCDGLGHGDRPSITIPAHGSGAGRLEELLV